MPFIAGREVTDREYQQFLERLTRTATPRATPRVVTPAVNETLERFMFPEWATELNRVINAAPNVVIQGAQQGTAGGTQTFTTTAATIEEVEFNRTFAVPDAPFIPEPKPLIKEEPTDEMPETYANDFMIGCDPEFVVLEPGTSKLVALSPFLNATAEVGYDHGGAVAELRPKPSKGSYTIIKRIQKMLTTHAGLGKLKNKNWRAGASIAVDIADNDPWLRRPAAGAKRIMCLGGHVHLDKRWDINRAMLEHQLTLIKACDRVTRYLERLDILPGAESEARRRRGILDGTNYGGWSDCRAAAGSAGDANYHVEYRTPCSWLFSPTAAFITLTAIKLAGINPQIALDSLPEERVSYLKLRNFFELFAGKDANARRVTENLFVGTIKDLEAKPDANVREAWEPEFTF